MTNSSKHELAFELAALAEKNGLHLNGEQVKINESGMDFLVG